MGNIRELWQKGRRYLKIHGFSRTVRRAFHKAGEGLRRNIYMPNYYDDLQNRLTNLRSRFPAHPRKTAIRLIWWNLKSLFHKHKKSAPPPELELQENRLNIAFEIGGGLGDYVIFANYLFFFRKRFSRPDIRIDVYFDSGFGYSETLFSPGGPADRLYPYEKFRGDMTVYDVFFHLSRYPNVLWWNPGRVVEYAPELLDYIFLCRKFALLHPQFFSHGPVNDGESASLSTSEGKKRITQPDIFNFLGITEEYSYSIPFSQDENIYLAELGLNGGRFLTLHRGSDVNTGGDSVKLWPLAHYNRLIGMIRKRYSELALVQLGISRDRCPAMEGISVDLVGKTSMEQVKILLKNSAVHIDCESGFVHLRHALYGGPSVVLFGPTSERFFGYSENLNIRGGGCPEPCEWKTADWQIRCVNGFEKPPCMLSIDPNRVIDELGLIL
jgi:hypothetical protein